MTNRTAVIRSTFMLALLAAVSISGCGDRTTGVPGPFGKTLVATFAVPEETLARFAQHNATAKNPKLSALENVAFSDGVEWAAPAIDVTTRSSPYRLAIRVEAAAPGAGPATSMWFGGWAKLDKDGLRGVTRSDAIALLGDADLPPDKVAAARTLNRIEASAPVTFKEDNRVIPVIELKSLRNMALKRVDVEVWSGIPSPTWREMLFGWQGAVTGLVMLALWFVVFGKRD